MARPLSLCDGCGQVDDHPKHKVGLGSTEVIEYSDEFVDKATDLAAGDPAKLRQLTRDVRDGTTRIMHFDCCLEAGCPNLGGVQHCAQALADKDHPFDGGKTTGRPLMKAMAAKGLLGETKENEV